MKYPFEYLDYLVHFHGDRDFFECHEILEEYWKSKNKAEGHWVALIQIAVGLYHHRRSNFRGAAKMLQNAVSYFSQHTVRLGMDNERLISLLNERIEKIKREEEYTDLNLPINDDFLLEQCLLLCQEKGWTWKSASSKEEDLIHRHSRRDRSDVIQEREKQLRMRRQNQAIRDNLPGGQPYS